VAPWSEKLERFDWIARSNPEQGQALLALAPEAPTGHKSL